MFQKSGKRVMGGVSGTGSLTSAWGAALSVVLACTVWMVMMQAQPAVAFSDTKRGLVWEGDECVHTFFAQEGLPVYVALRGDGDTDLDLFLMDDRRHIVARSGRVNSDQETVRWVPRRSGPLLVVVQNHGEVWNEYSLETNGLEERSSFLVEW